MPSGKKALQASKVFGMLCSKIIIRSCLTTREVFSLPVIAYAFSTGCFSERNTTYAQIALPSMNRNPRKKEEPGK